MRTIVTRQRLQQIGQRRQKGAGQRQRTNRDIITAAVDHRQCRRGDNISIETDRNYRHHHPRGDNHRHGPAPTRDYIIIVRFVSILTHKWENNFIGIIYTAN